MKLFIPFKTGSSIRFKTECLRNNMPWEILENDNTLIS